MMSSVVIKRFEAILDKELELVYFTGMLVGHGGNSGGQVVSTVIRALGSKEIALSDARHVIMRESLAGLVQSLILTLAIAPFLVMLGISSGVSRVVMLNVPILGLLANTLGAALPFAITAAGQDPAVIVGPLMTTCIDTFGNMIYLTIATHYLMS